jgi:ribulose-5-phosphate 4-epimerase/fuculose-1-phosphate aldolase
MSAAELDIAISRRPPFRPAIYAVPRGNGLKLPPSNRDFAQERLHRKQRLAAAFRVFARYGYDYGGAGHITARDPEHTDHFWVNPAGVWFGHIRVSDLLLVNHHGEIVEGEGMLNRAAFAIHSQLHHARPDVIAAAHAHSTHGKAWSTLGRLLDPITQDACAFYGDHALFDDFTGVVLDTSEGERIAHALGDKSAVILRNHGLLTTGGSVESAVWRFIAMDDAARTQLLAEAAGAVKPLSHEVALHTSRQFSGEVGGWFSFQPLWDIVSREQPDLFE